jgi:DTW domain-containing protein YfiP
MRGPVAAEPRAVCARCRRPESVCYCGHIEPLETATRVVLLQHPRERDVPIGTARMASLCLRDAELHVGVHWHGSSALTRALSDPARPAVLLYPGPGAIDVVRNPPTGPVTLIVVDGTWSQTKKVVRENPELAALPRYAFTPSSPSEYRIRKEPDAGYVSTIEALVHVLAALEPDGARFRALLRPFRAMVDAQLACAARSSGSRHRHAPSTRRRRLRVPALFRERPQDLVCVVGEANAWPYRSPERETAYPDELVQWAAHRLETGETFDFVLAPVHPISPTTPLHTELPRAILEAGGSASELFERWRAFTKSTDVVCSWGRYATSIFAARGGHLPPIRLDLRQIAREFTRKKVGTVEHFIAGIEAPSGKHSAQHLARGRAGVRLANACQIARYFCAADADTVGENEAPLIVDGP